ncbi:hypothetical protein MWH03_00515 [Klebsiella pneumoniae]|nr:hypothetical protein [Klebsiella pneumoniae]
MSSNSITGNQGLVVLHDTAMVSELFSVMGLVLGTKINSRVAPDDRVFSLMNEGLGKIELFHFGMGVKVFVNVDEWTARHDKKPQNVRDIIQPRMLPQIDELVSYLQLEGAKLTDIGIAPLQLRPGVFCETPGIVMFNIDGGKTQYKLALIQLTKLLALNPKLETERWQLLNNLQEKFGTALPLTSGTEPESTMTYTTQGPRVVVDICCGDLHNQVDCVLELDNYIFHQNALCEALEFIGATREVTDAPGITPVDRLSAEEQLAVLRTKFPDWGKW